MHSLTIGLIFLCSVSTTIAADWPQWRGPNGTGVAEGPLPTKDGQLWKVAIPVPGTGSPIIIGGKIYLQSASEDGTKRTLVCLNAIDGKIVWSTSHDAEKVPSHKKSGLAANTPAADSASVYCVWWDGATASLRAYDSRTGVERWYTPLGRNTSQHGVNHSPILHAGMLYLNLDQDDKAEILAFDPKTGKIVWSAERPANRASYTTPILLERAGHESELIVSNSAGIDSYVPKSGKVNWSYRITWPDGDSKLRMIGSPILTQGLLVVQTGDGGGSRYTVAIKPGGPGDISKTAMAWQLKKGTPYIPGMIAQGDYLFWITDQGQAVCAEAKNGNVIWNERVFDRTAWSSPVLLEGGILAVSESGRVVTWKVSKEFEQIEKWELDEQVIASPAVTDNRIYIRGSTHLFCYGKK